MELIPAAYIPIVIYFARILDVSMGTLRIMFVSKGMRGKATLLGFFEVLIWITVVAQIFQNLDNWYNYIAFAGGFATGTFVGMLIEDKLKVGTQIFRIITNKEAGPLVEKMRDAGFGVTSISGDGVQGSVKVIFTIVKRKRSSELIRMINEFDSKAFYSVEDVKYSSQNHTSLAGAPLIFTRMLSLKKGL